ncbi:DUF3857 domain-containing protein [Chiayiivirga flava]|uniref:Transglutaminase-like putative cysteine protease n=1 Tax=Chiayiivirga flava TaxID=659595 RepID=A0A7W8D351_9GAMM|nr:DUF3857 domain-containing protein [Chiayiivirga flava]MBB5207088.1 transglutaminase-like putative cysteine protease [Chiayiivirga flava]
MRTRQRQGWAAVIVWLALVGIGVGVGGAHGAEPVREVRSGDYVFSVAPPPAFVEPLDIASAWDEPGETAPFAADARWRLWLADTQVDRRHGGRVRYVDYAYEAVSQELVGEAAKVQIDFSPEFEQLTLHAVELRREGRWSNRLVPERVTLARREAEFERDMATGTVTALLVLDDVRAGDVVRMRYSVTGANPILAGQIDEYAGFGWTQPQLHRRLRVLFAPGTQIAEQRHAGVPVRREVTRPDAVEVVYEQKRIAAFRDEGIYPRWYEPIPGVTVGQRRSWSEVATWAGTLYPPPAALSAGLRERLSAWRALPDDEARLAAALRAVQEEVRYFGVEIGESTHRPAEPAVVWERRYGDCKDKVRLLVTVLGELGIAAQPALVSAQRGRGVADLPPSGASFDHVIARVQLGDSVLWLDPTATQQRGSPRELAVGDFGLALPVMAGSDRLVPVTRPAAAVDAVRALTTFVVEGDAVLMSVDTEYRGAAAERQRLSLVTRGREALDRQYADHYRRVFGELDVVEPLALDDVAVENMVRARERYRLTAPWAEAGPGQRLLDVPIDHIGGETMLPAVLERTAPLPLNHPVRIEQTTRIELPAGWRWIGRADDETFEDQALHFTTATRQASDGAIVVERSLRSTADAVPVEMLRDHFRLRRSINDSLSQRIVLALPAEEATRQRDRRLNGLMRDLMDEKARKGRHGAQ